MMRVRAGGKVALPFGLLFWYAKIMGKAITRTRKSRGRPSTGASSVHLRVLPDQLAKIDAWIKRQGEADLTRPEAIRQLIERGLQSNRK